MRLATALIALLVGVAAAGCGSPGRDGGDDGDGVAPQAPASFDRLIDVLPEDSGDAQPFAVEEDAVTAGAGRMAFVTGRGMHCAGDLDPVAPNATGWVACFVRLANRTDAQAMGVHALGVGNDTQRLTPRLAAELVEWRVTVTVLDLNTERVPFDSGWRPVDLSPRLTDVAVSYTASDICDLPDATEEQTGRRGLAVVQVAFTVAHGQANLTLDTARSIPLEAEGAETSQSFSAHGYAAGFNFAGPRLPFLVNLTVDLEAPEEPTPGAQGPCDPTLATETQVWSARLTVRGADGVTLVSTLEVDADVALTALPPPPV